VKGLLKQFSPNFNVAEAWKVLCATSNADRSLEWSKDDAKTLKRKLEFHEGSAIEIATEARILASKFYGEIDGMAWTSADSLAPATDFGDNEKGGWRNTSSTMPQGSPFQKATARFGTLGGMPSFI